MRLCIRVSVVDMHGTVHMLRHHLRVCGSRRGWGWSALDEKSIEWIGDNDKEGGRPTADFMMT